jgi:hypothetical protein
MSTKFITKPQTKSAKPRSRRTCLSLFGITDYATDYTLGLLLLKLFIVLIYKCSQKVRMFVPGKPFQPCLMFVSLSRAVSSESP